MEEHLFLCGLSPAQRAAYDGGTRLQINGADENVILKIEEIRKKYVTNVPDVLTDLLEIAGYVFAADNSVTRGGPAFRNMGSDWRRSFRLVIGVRELERWSTTEMRRALRDLLSFISDDSWQLQFVKLENPKKWPDYFDFSRNNDEPGASNIVLFSGGLDSLAGAVHELKHSNQRIVLVSHKSSPIAINRQTELARELRKRNGKRVFHVPVRVNMTKQQPAIEDTQRTRGFLFTAIAAVVAHLEGAHRIRLYENGIMSVNLPISTQVVGTRATRTTHPHSLKLLEKLIRLMQGGETTIDNPFIWMTKSEVVQVLRDPADRNLIAQSISCSNTREMTKMHWHCGTCAQCLQRRIGTLGADLGEADPKEEYAIDMLTGPRDSVESLQMAIDMIRSALEFRRLSDEGFTHRFAGEFSRLNVSFAGVTQAEAARNFVDLFRRHGNTVRNVLIDAAKANAEGLIDRTLPANCLVRIAVDQPDWEPESAPLPGPVAAVVEPSDTHIDYTGTTEVQLAVETRERRKWILIDGLPPIKGSTSFRLLSYLVALYLDDQRLPKRAENHQFATPETLVELGAATLIQNCGVFWLRAGSLPSLFSGEPMGTGATYSATASRCMRILSMPIRPRKYDGTSAVTLTRSRLGLASWVTAMVVL
jgi:7-cyano-7-deazaguanine synthase in queuosine biosynthesis